MSQRDIHGDNPQPIEGFEPLPGFLSGVELKTSHGGPRLAEDMPTSLALSGGGHRASLFALGAMMALFDADKSPAQIASVSGGSITNAFLALRYFAAGHDLGSRANPEDWERATRECFDAISTKGVLTRPWIAALAALLVLPPLVFLGLALSGRLPAVEVTLSLAAAWATVVFFRGLLIERLLHRTCFSGLRSPRLAGCESPIEHVLCCTDLVTGRPFYASTRGGGIVFQRTGEPTGGGWMPGRSPHAIQEDPPGFTYQGGALTWASLVRASAGFPGIPPRRFRLELEDGSHHLAFLSDGGIWNNLATQAFEDRFIWSGDGPWVVLVIDASAPLERHKAGRLHVPLLSEIVALVRQVVIQNFNTVLPRRAIYEREVLTEALFPGQARFKATRLYPVVALGDSLDSILQRFARGAEQNDPYAHNYEEGHRERMEEHRRALATRCEALESSADYLDLKQLTESSVDGLADEVTCYPTTLGAVEPSIATRIVARGYANTSLNLYLTGLTDQLQVPSGWLAEELKRFRRSRTRPRQ